MSQDFEIRRDTDWHPLPDCSDRGLRAQTVGGRQRLGAAASRPPAHEPDSFSSAKDWLRAAPGHLANLTAEELIGAVARIEQAYQRFPALELDCPRALLVEALQLSAGTIPDNPAIPLLMAGAVLDAAPSSAAVAMLLDRMARAGHGDAICGVVAILARRRSFAPGEITPALDELCRQGRASTALAVISEAFGHIGADMAPAAAELGATLKRILAAEIGDEVDPAELAKTILAACNRVQLPPPALGTKHRVLQLLAVAERVAAKLPQFPVSPSPVAASALRRAGGFGVAEPRAGSPAIEIGGVAVDWLPVMQVGHAGERNHTGVSAKPGCSGHLVYGPYLKLGAGDYRVRVCCSVGQPSRTGPRDRLIAAIEAVSRHGKTYLAQRELRVEDCHRPAHDLVFRISSRLSPVSPIEVRVWTSGEVPLTVSSVTVERVEAS